jgi:hypothetical protein
MINEIFKYFIKKIKPLNQRRKKHTHLPVETVQETARALKALTALRQLIKCM